MSNKIVKCKYCGRKMTEKTFENLSELGFFCCINANRKYNKLPLVNVIEQKLRGMLN